jgi:hypothetical protein
VRIVRVVVFEEEGGMQRPFSRRVVPFLLGLTALAAPALAQQPAPPSLEDLQQELESLRRDYAERIAALEARLEALRQSQSPTSPAPAPPPEAPPSEGTIEPAPTAAPVEASVPPGAAGAGGPTGALPVYGSFAPGSKVFNPDIAAIGNFLGTSGEGPGVEPSLEMSETELTLQAIVDPYARADFFLTFGPDEVGIEEAFLTFPTLPAGLLAKAGRMRDAFGKINAMHPHSLPWADRPLVTRNLLGGEEGLADSGVSVSRLLPNPWLFLEATAQVYQGNSELFAAPRRRDVSYVGHLRGYRDLSESANLDLGGSFAWGRNDTGAGNATRLLGIDATFRYRPLRRAIYRRLLGRAELVWSRREQDDGRRDAFGMYASAEYQFARRWFAGARYDRSQRADDPRLRDEGGSLLLTYWPSEFSQVRGQFRRTRFGEGETANELLFQLLFSIGAHGAHVF